MSVTAEPAAPDIVNEIAAGDFIDFCAVGRRFGVHTSTIHRWAFRGVPGQGRRVRLEAVRRGMKWLTSSAAVQRFLAKLPRSVPDDEGVAPLPRSPSTRERASETAAAELHRRHGI
jgi:Protein of unknown function (DUF1580)